MSDWRDHVQNDASGGKDLPEIVSPGGRVIYHFRTKLPQLPPPQTMTTDYPYIRVDNWQIHFFPMSKKKMAWLGESTAHWVRRNPDRAYRRRVLNFINEIERLSGLWKP